MPALALLLGLVACAAKEIVVRFPDLGPDYPTGTITLSQDTADGDLTITTSLSRLEANAAGNGWHVHNFPTHDSGGVDDECGGGVTGGHFNPTFKTTTPCPDQADCEIGDLDGKHGNLAAVDGQTTDVNTYTDTTASIIYSSASGSKGNMWIVGRSIVIHKAEPPYARWVCANIGDAGVGVTATFTAADGTGGPTGTIELFQPSAADTTAMIVSLTGFEQGGNKWHVHEYAVPSVADCAGTGGHFDPLSADYDAGEFEYGDLSGKWGLLNAPSAASAADAFVGTGQGFVADATLPLSGDKSVLGRSIVIHRTDGSRWACVTIPSRIHVTFPDLGAGYPYGTIILYQAAVDADLAVTTSLRQLDGAAAGNKWHVHAFPTDADGGFDQGCGPAVTGGHFNPTFKTVTPCPDQADCEVGDFAGKLGNLGLGVANESMAYTDETASIIYNPTQQTKGAMWIVGRSIVIHKAEPPYARWVCANIGDAGMGTTVKFAGTGVPTGTIELFQPSLFWPTGMLVNLATAALEAGGNKWHVHVQPLPGSGDCAGTGGHYDPLSADYDAGEFEIGDLSGKWGLLNAPSAASAADAFVGTGQGFVADATLPLAGAYSVMGRSIVIHRTDGSRWACADIAARSYRATFNVLDGPEGYIELFQPNADTQTTISVNLQGLGTGEKAWHVHQLAAPSESGDSTGEACGRTGAHFNPSFGTGTAEDGDLTARHGYFSEATSRMFAEDAMVMLHGNKSVVGRSIVIHRASGARWGCASIGPGGHGFTLTFPSIGSDYPSGTAQFFQRDATALTTVTVAMSNMPVAPGAGWALRKLAVPDRAADAGSGVCGSLGGVYAAAEGGAPKAGELDELLGPLVGDATSSAYEAELHGAAAGLPLFGEETIEGASLVVYEAVGGRAWVCATVGREANSTLEQLEWELQLLGTDLVELTAAWMRLGGQPLCGVATGLLAAICTVLLVPGILQALVVGYSWAYAFGVSEGWPLGAIALWVGTSLGALLAYTLGQTVLHKLFSEEAKTRTFLARAENAMQHTPLRLLVLMRLLPLVPFNLFNYYVGASFRFKFWHACASLPFTFPGCIIWVGVGAAWLKGDLISWGYAQPSEWEAKISAGIGVTVAFTVLSSAAGCFVLYRAEKFARQGDLTATKEVAIDIDGGDGKKKKRGLFGRKPPPAAAPARKQSTTADDEPPVGELQDGWRQVTGDDGDVYFYNDETGESQWEAPLKPAGMPQSCASSLVVSAPPLAPPPPPTYAPEDSNANAAEMMAE